MEHFRQTGFPLAVKLGTITADGKGDVFSYAEDDMVEDPFLADHLKHFGINVQQLQKVLFANTTMYRTTTSEVTAEREIPGSTY